jgi:hypothetical protein
MKTFLVLTIAVLESLAIAPNESQAQRFTVTFSGEPVYYAPGYYGYRFYNYDPGNEYYYYHRRVYYPRSYQHRFYYGPDHRYYRWYQIDD